MTSFRQNQEKPIVLPINGHALGALQWVELRMATLLLATCNRNIIFQILHRPLNCLQLYSYKHSRVTTRFLWSHWLDSNYEFYLFCEFKLSWITIKSRLICHFIQKRFICSVSRYVLHILDLLESAEHNSISVIGLILEGGDVIEGESSVRWDEIEQVEKVWNSRSTRKSDFNWILSAWEIGNLVIISYVL